jgi:hypothetical protein
MSQDDSFSRNGVRIRLTDERWQHILEEHGELADLRDELPQAISHADRVLKGNAGELFAVRMLEPTKAIVVIYREVDLSDGFVITAFLTRRLTGLNKREQVWPPLT